MYAAKVDDVVEKGELPTLGSYYNKLCKASGPDDFGNLCWFQENYGAEKYRGWEDWVYSEAFQKYAVDPLHDLKLTSWGLDTLKPV